MKKAVLVLVVLSLLAPFSAFAAPPETPEKNVDDFSIQPAGKDTWKILNGFGRQVGTLRTADEKGAYSVQLMDGTYMGFILGGGDLKKPQRHPAISPSEAKFYLNTWAAIQKMKK